MVRPTIVESREEAPAAPPTPAAAPATSGLDREAAAATPRFEEEAQAGRDSECHAQADRCVASRRHEAGRRRRSGAPAQGLRRERRGACRKEERRRRAGRVRRTTDCPRPRRRLTRHVAISRWTDGLRRRRRRARAARRSSARRRSRSRSRRKPTRRDPPRQGRPARAVSWAAGGRRGARRTDSARARRRPRRRPRRRRPRATKLPSGRSRRRHPRRRGGRARHGAAPPPPAPAAKPRAKKSADYAPEESYAAEGDAKKEEKQSSASVRSNANDTLLQRADRLFADGRWTEAAAIYRELLRRDPHNDDAERWRRRLAAAETAEVNERNANLAEKRNAENARTRKPRRRPKPPSRRAKRRPPTPRSRLCARRREQRRRNLAWEARHAVHFRCRVCAGGTDRLHDDGAGEAVGARAARRLRRSRRLERRAGARNDQGRAGSAWARIRSWFWICPAGVSAAASPRSKSMTVSSRAGRTMRASSRCPPTRSGASPSKSPNHTRTIGAVVGVAALLLVLAGVYVLATADTSQSVPGRPLRARGKVVTAPLAAREGCDEVRDGWQGGGPVPNMSSLSRAAREVLADEWTANARAEHASVPAFSRLSLTLVSLGAPARLVEGAHRAALEEIEHARRGVRAGRCVRGRAGGPGRPD